MPRDGFEDFGLKTRTGALVAQVSPGGASAKAGIQPGDVIIEFNGRPVPNSNELVKMVIAHQAGHVGAGEGAARESRRRR